MNAAKYIRYILTIATALLFFSACKDDKNESQPTDFILRVNESESIKATQLDKLYHNDQ